MNTSIQVLKKGELLFSEGDTSDYIYYLRRGRLEAYTETNHRRTVLGQILTNEFVGELGVLQNTIRTASVIALEDSELELYSKESFIDVISQNNEKSIQILYSLSVRVRNLVLLNTEIALQIAEHNPAYSLNPVKSLLVLISRTFKTIKNFVHNREYKRHKKRLPPNPENGSYTLAKNQAVFYEGEKSQFAARVIRGQLKAVKTFRGYEETMGIIDAGDFVGEIGLLEGAPRSLTIIATQETELEVFHEDTFLRLISNDVKNIIDLISRLSRRATQLNNRLKLQSQKHIDILNTSTLIQARQLLVNISDVSQLTGRMLECDLVMLKNALKQETIAVQGMMETYYRYINGKADKKEMDNANAEFRNFLKTLGLSALIIIPGSFITIPLIVKMSRTLGINILPKSRTPDEY